MEQNALRAVKTPCSECPWRQDIACGRFPPERFQALARTAHDMSIEVFTCHKSSDVSPAVCAGFLTNGADHNLAVRRAYRQGSLEPGNRAGGSLLYPSYRDMAEANGVHPDDPALALCRDRRD